MLSTLLMVPVDAIVRGARQVTLSHDLTPPLSDGTVPAGSRCHTSLGPDGSRCHASLGPDGSDMLDGTMFRAPLACTLLVVRAACVAEDQLAQGVVGDLEAKHDAGQDHSRISQHMVDDLVGHPQSI